MSFDLDIAGDFAEVVDGLRSVGLRNRAGTLLGLDNVLRRAVRTREAAASNGRYTASDTVFHCPITDQSKQVRPGWKIVDDDGLWTVLECGTETLRNRNRFICRNLALVFDLVDAVNLQLATWAKNDSGVQVATWATAQESIPCRITIQSAENETEHGLRNQPRQATIQLEAVNLVTESHRFVRVSDGTVFNIVGWSDAESIDKLMTVNCEVVPWPLS